MSNELNAIIESEKPDVIICVKSGAITDIKALHAELSFLVIDEDENSASIYGVSDESAKLHKDQITMPEGRYTTR